MVFRELDSRQLKSRLLLQVHDELLLEVPESELTEVAAILKSSMENAYCLKVPLVVSLKTGPNWYDLQEFNP
jgi:DNA polymerase-1